VVDGALSLLANMVAEMNDAETMIAAWTETTDQALPIIQVSCHPWDFL
jgi:hypothetical protein